MPVFNPPDQLGAKFKWINGTIPSGNTVASSLALNQKTAFASATTIPEEHCLIGGIAHISGRGVYGSGAVSLPLTLTVEMAGVVVATAAVTPLLNLANMAWGFDISATILDSGQVEVQGYASFATALSAATIINIRNTATFAMSVSGGVPVTISVQWGALALGGTITLRQAIVEVL